MTILTPLPVMLSVSEAPQEILHSASPRSEWRGKKLF